MHPHDTLAENLGKVLSTLPLHLEKVLRDHFRLEPNLLLEDVCPGDLHEALRMLNMPTRRERLRILLGLTR